MLLVKRKLQSDCWCIFPNKSLAYVMIVKPKNVLNLLLETLKFIYLSTPPLDFLTHSV